MDFNKTLHEIISEIDALVDAGLGNGGCWSVRYNNFWKYKRADNNIFSAASTLFILNQYKKHLTDYQQNTIEKITKKIRLVFTSYQNKDGRKTYNFYPTKPSRHFANGLLMQRFDHFRLPDDIDDTALIYLASNPPQREVSALKKILKNHLSDSSSGLIYDTWFGKNMPHEHDVCALCNLMFLIFANNTPLEKEDTNTLDFLAKNIQNISQKPFAIARHYGHPALIIYHYARLMSGFEIDQLEKKKMDLIKISKEALAHEKNTFFRQLIEISLIKLGENVTINNQPPLKPEAYTFIGAPLAPYPFFGNLAFKKPFLIFYQSRIHQLALKLEHLLLSSNIGIK